MSARVVLKTPVPSPVARISFRSRLSRSFSSGEIRCHRIGGSRRIATVEAKVRDGEGNLVALGTGTFRIFEKRGTPIV